MCMNFSLYNINSENFSMDQNSIKADPFNTENKHFADRVQQINGTAVKLIMNLGLALSTVALVGGVALAFTATTAALVAIGAIISTVGIIALAVIFAYYPMPSFSKDKTPDLNNNNLDLNKLFNNSNLERGPIDVNKPTGLRGGYNRCFLNSCLQSILATSSIRILFDSDQYIVPHDLPNQSERLEVQEILNNILTDISNFDGTTYSHDNHLLTRLYHLLNELAPKQAQIVDGQQNDADELLNRCLVAIGVDFHLEFSTTQTLGLLEDLDFSQSLEVSPETHPDIFNRNLGVFRLNPETGLLSISIQESQGLNFDALGGATPNNMKEYIQALSSQYTATGDSLVFYNNRYYFFQGINRTIVTKLADNQNYMPDFLMCTGVDSVSNNGISMQKDPEIDICGEKYLLKAAIHHVGGRNGGHYTAGVINQNGVYLCNDSQVRSCSINDSVFKGARMWIYEKAKKI